ncbi:hypothetical protein Patl1_13240 [Pistacia atlantica]|uniref:Uncharacterized protein n=1 Tax=Pistacia atlantica TaxID=434234 RepID=A0ACC1ATQ6_9ROSI|nr:hypothetical protein Patl1_13240 [Pistacia atlantica]
MHLNPTNHPGKSGFNKYVLLCSLLASTNSILLGYDTGVMSGAVLYIKDYMKINSVKPAVFLPGVAVGYALMIAPLYTSEIAPPSKRGFLTSLPEFFIVMGILLGYIVNYILSDLPPNINWRLMLGIAALPSAYYFIWGYYNAGISSLACGRPLLFIGTTGMVVSLAVLGAGSKVLENSTDKPLWAIVMSIIAVCADVSFFSIGLGPITWVYSTEIFPSKIRAQASGLGISVNRLVSGAVAMSFLSISEAISFGGMFFVLSGIMVVANIHFYFFLPETKGKTLEEMVKIFEKNDSKQET